MNKWFAVLVVVFSVTACSHKIMEPEKSPLTVFHDVRIIDGKGQVIESGSLILRDGRIEEVRHGDFPLPMEARVIEMEGRTVMPTLIAAHTHLGMTHDLESGRKEITEDNVLRQLNKFKRYGVGAVLSLGTDLDFIYDLRERRQKGELKTPWIMTAGHGFGVLDGAPPAAMGMDQVYRPKSVKEVQQDMEILALHHPDVVKLWLDDFNHTLKKKMDPKIYQAVITEAHKHGLKVAAHVYYLADAKRLAKDGIDIFAHSVRDQKVDQEFIDLVKKNHIAYIPTLALDEASFIYAENPAWMQTSFFKDALDHGIWEWLHSSLYKAKPDSRKDLEIAKQNVLTLFKAGVDVGFGTDSGASLQRIQGFSEHHELELLVSAGFTPEQALESATSVNASILGLQDRGVVAPGMKADLLVLNGDPLKDIRNTQKIHSVWLEGQQVYLEK